MYLDIKLDKVIYFITSMEPYIYAILINIILYVTLISLFIIYWLIHAYIIGSKYSKSFNHFI